MGLFGVRERRGTGRGAERDAERWGSRRVFPVGRAGSPRRVLRRGGCPIRFAVDAGSDGTRIGFEGTHVIVDLDENIAEVVQVRHQHVRIHRPTNPARPRSVWGDSNTNSETGAVTARAPSVFLSAKGRRGVDTANDARGTFTTFERRVHRPYFHLASIETRVVRAKESAASTEGSGHRRGHPRRGIYSFGSTRLDDRPLRPLRPAR